MLRIVFALTLLAQGGYCLQEAHGAVGAWLVGLSALAAGTLLLIGFLTPVAGVVVGVVGLGVGSSLLPACESSLFDSKAALVFAGTMLVEIVVLGPGAFSIDARIFGRREIIIPPASPHARR